MPPISKHSEGFEASESVSGLSRGNNVNGGETPSETTQIIKPQFTTQGSNLSLPVSPLIPTVHNSTASITTKLLNPRAQDRRMRLLQRRWRNAVRSLGMSRQGQLAPVRPNLASGDPRSSLLTASRIVDQPLQHYHVRGGYNDSQSDALEDSPVPHLDTITMDTRKRKRTFSPHFTMAEIGKSAPATTHDITSAGTVSNSGDTKFFWVFDTDSEGLPTNGRRILGGTTFEEVLLRNEVTFEDLEGSDDVSPIEKPGWNNAENSGPTEGEEAAVVRLIGDDGEEPIDDPTAMEHRVCGRARRRRRDSGFSTEDFIPLTTGPPTATSATEIELSATSSLRGGVMMSMAQHVHSHMTTLKDGKQVGICNEKVDSQESANHSEPTKIDAGAPLSGFSLSAVGKLPAKSRHATSDTSIPSASFSALKLKPTSPPILQTNSTADVPQTRTDKVSQKGKRTNLDDAQSQIDTVIQIPLHDGASDDSDTAIEIPEPGPQPYPPLSIKSDWGNWISGEKGPYGDSSN